MSVHGSLRRPVRRELLGNGGVSCTPILAGQSPTLWAVYDGLFSPGLVSAAASEFPCPEWTGWFRYDSPGEKKLAANTGIPESCARLLEEMNRLCPDDLLIDEDLYAGGLHAIPPGGWLDLHLDAELHRNTGMRRHTNLILFLDDWNPRDGGQLEFWDRDVSRCDLLISPSCGRAVAFDCRNVVHGIPNPTSPFGPWRRSLAVFWYEKPEIRERAQFVAAQGEDDDPEKDFWRRSRKSY